MTTSTRPQGTATWIDLTATDPARTREFYTAVLGWEWTDPVADFGGYQNAHLGGALVAGLSPVMDGAPTNDGWVVYLAADDVSAVHAAVEAAGGATVVPPMELADLGSMALYRDPTGAVFGTWQAGSHTGFGVQDVPGAVCWTEAMTGDLEAGEAFYGSVFSWTYADISDGDMRYAIFTAPGDSVDKGSGGIGQVDQGDSPSWSVVFAVDDVDAAVSRVRDAGGTVHTEPFDFDYGRIAVVGGPDGEPFSLMKG